MDWIISSSKVEYQQALNLMETRVANIIKKKQSEAIWLLEHDDVYTAGTSANMSDLKDSKKFHLPYWVDERKLYNYMFPSFTKKIFKYLENN